MRQSLHLFCSTTQGFNPVSHYKKETQSLIQVEQCGTGTGVLTITEKYLQEEHQTWFISTAFFFHKLTLVFLLKFFFMLTSKQYFSLTLNGLLYKIGSFAPQYWYFWLMVNLVPYKTIDLIDYSLWRSPGAIFFLQSHVQYLRTHTTFLQIVSSSCSDWMIAVADICCLSRGSC